MSAATDQAVYKTLLESTRAIPWKIDWKTMTFAYIGPQIETLLGWSQASWVSAEDWATRMHPDDREKVVQFCIAQSQNGVDHEADYRALTAAGDYVWIRDVVHVVRDDNGEVDALIGFMFDISERKKTEEQLLTLQKQLEEYSYKDGLTGVANRRMFDMVLATEWANAQRSQQPLSLILLDIDHFKQYNDHYGHVQGDDCLKSVGQALSRAVKGRGISSAASVARSSCWCCRRPMRPPPGTLPNAAASRCVSSASRTRAPPCRRCSPSASAWAPSCRAPTTVRRTSSAPSTSCSTRPSNAVVTAWRWPERLLARVWTKPQMSRPEQSLTRLGC